MSAAPSGWAAGLLLIVLGVWVVLQTIVGNLAGRILGLGTAQPGNYQPGVGTGPGGSNAGNPPGYSAGSTTPGGSPNTPPAGWLPVPNSKGWYYSPKQPGEVWIPGQGVLQQ